MSCQDRSALTSLGENSPRQHRGPHDRHIVRVGDYWLDFAPSDGYLLINEHRDQPGMIGAVGTICGRNDVNISFMEVGRLEPRGRAVMILGLDDSLSAAVLDEINRISGVENARVVQV